MDVALQVAVGGLAAGGIYGLVAIGHSLVYRLTGVVHFAFGELLALCVFAALLIAAGTAPVTESDVGGLRFLVAVAGGIAVAGAASAGSYYLAVQPYQLRGSTIGWVAASLAVAFALRTVLATIFDRSGYVFPDPLPFDEVGDGGFWHVGASTIEVRALFVIAVAVVLAAATTWTLARTRFGRALEAISNDVEAARTVGLPVSRLVGLAFALAGAVAGLAAVVAAPSHAFDVDTAALYGVKGLAAAAVVGFAPFASFVSGIAFGLLEAGLADASWAGPSYSRVVPFALALCLLAVHAHRRRPAVE